MSNVLVVEDDAAIREMMRRRLAMRGFDVRVATNGVEALEVASEYRPDTILLDLELPDGMSGWDVVRILRSDPRTASTRIFVITAHVTASDMERAGRTGCARFFGKPVDFRALVEALGGGPALVESR
jgi:CheY-like chemotaxis protein